MSETNKSKQPDYSKLALDALANDPYGRKVLSEQAKDKGAGAELARAHLNNNRRRYGPASEDISEPLPRPKYTSAKRRGGALLLAAGVVAGSIAGMNYLDAQDDQRAQRVEQEALDKVSNYIPATLVLNTGVNVRSEPRIDNGDSSTGEEGNVAFRVEPGQALVVDRPVMTTDKDGTEWFAFTMPTDQQNQSPESFFVRADVLQQNREDGTSFAGLTPYSNTSEAQQGAQVFYDAKIGFVTDGSLEVSTAHFMNSAEVQAHIETVAGGGK